MTKRFIKKRVSVPKSQPPLAFAVAPQISPGIIRTTPRTARKGETLFDAEGRPVSVRNAPRIRRLRKRRR